MAARPGFRLDELVARFGGELLGDPDICVEQVATLATAAANSISFYHRADYAQDLEKSRAGAVIVAPRHRDATPIARIIADDPYLYFARVSALLNPVPRAEPGIHPSAVVAASATVDATAAIGPHCVIGDGTRIGSRVSIGAGTIVGRDVAIGDDCLIHANVTIYDGCIIGARAIVHAGAVIGADGFGFANDRGRWLKIPQIGRVVIGDDVEIGANSAIDRGAIDDTIIEDGVKLDNHVQIGHNCRIGAHTAIAGCVGIAGSTTIGRQCMIGGAAMISGHLNIVDRTIIHGGTLITKSIDVADTYAGGWPADRKMRWRRTAALLRNIDSIVDRIRVLERGATVAPSPPQGKREEGS